MLNPWLIPVWLARLLHFLGLTQCSDAELEEYVRLRRRLLKRSKPDRE